MAIHDKISRKNQDFQKLGSKRAIRFRATDVVLAYGGLEAPMTSTPTGRKAVVIGAGMAGLAAAGALADYFEQVVVLERDALPAEPKHRSGTPQSQHPHTLLLSGMRALDELFPDFEQDLVRAGAVVLKSGLDERAERPGYDPFPQRDLGLRSYALSRPAIEFAVRRRVEGRANVTLRQRCRVQEVLAAKDRSIVTGVRFGNGEGTTEALSTDLVVDASGRGALTLALLRAMDHPLPEETIIGVDIAYSTCIFAIPADAPTDWKLVRTLGQAPDSRGAMMLPIEGNRWMACMVGRDRQAPPGSVEGFLSFARGLRTPTIYNAIKHAERLSEVVRYGFRDNLLRHFERLPVFPRGLLPVGDVICRLNPVYGQGMSVAAQEASVLKMLLAKWTGNVDQGARLAPAFFEEVAKLIDTPWAGTDFEFVFPNTRGQRPADFDVTLKFRLALTRLAAEDPAIHKLTAEVQNLLKPRSVYRDPELMQRVRAAMAEA